MTSICQSQPLTCFSVSNRLEREKIFTILYIMYHYIFTKQHY